MKAICLAALVLASCGRGVDARLSELASENARLSRELEDVRRRLPGAAVEPSAPQPEAGARRAEALAWALLDRLPPPTDPLNAEAATGVWRATTGAEVLHLAAGNRLCGYVLAGSERRPFWGTWELRRGRLVEFHDRWVGDHNEVDARVREATGDATSMTLDTRFERVASSGWSGLANVDAERDVRLPGLPEWCLRP